MFGRKKDQDSGFIATLKLPKYIPKDMLLGKIVFDYNLERVGKAIDWTYSPEGQVSLVITVENQGKRFNGGDRFFLPFEYIERAGKFILLTDPIDSILPKKPTLSKEELREKAIVALEKEFEEENGEEEEDLIETEEKLPKSNERKRKTVRRKKPKKQLKTFNELDEELLTNILEPSE